MFNVCQPSRSVLECASALALSINPEPVRMGLARLMRSSIRKRRGSAALQDAPRIPWASLQPQSVVECATPVALSGARTPARHPMDN